MLDGLAARQVDDRLGVELEALLHQRVPEFLIVARQREGRIPDALSALEEISHAVRDNGRVFLMLGYPVPKTFKKVQPRFPGQNFDTYVQKSNNLQIWNEEVSASRRYVIIRVNDMDIVTKVRVVTGDVIAAFDTTGTLTHKYQAKARKPPTQSQENF